MREIGSSVRFLRDKFVPLYSERGYSDKDIRNKEVLALFSCGFVPFLSRQNFVSWCKILQVADLKRLVRMIKGRISLTTRISGILRDFYYCPMQYPLSKVFFMYQNNADAARGYHGFRYFYIKVHPDNEKQALQYARRIYSQYSKKEISEDMQIIQLSTLMELFNRPEKTMFRIFLLLAVLCILISSFGVFFLVSLSTEQRKKEIAIRKVNGAQFSDILYLFLKEYLWLTLVSNAIALPLGYLFIKRWLETYAYHTDIHGWLFVCVFLFTCIIVILSVMRQVVVAAKINPAESVKSE